MASAKAQRRADKAKQKIFKIRDEIERWKGARPKLVRVNHGDFLALTECNYITSDGRLSGTSIEVKPG